MPSSPSASAPLDSDQQIAAASPLWISEDDVGRLLSIADAIDVLAAAHARYGAGAASNMVRTHASSGEAILHAVGGIVDDVAGTKIWMHTPGGAHPMLVLFSPADGRVLAMIEAFAMGQMRTSATSAVGTRVLARADASAMAVLGTGKQALSQVVAVAAVRELERVCVFGRDAGRRAAFAERVADALDQVTVDHTGDPAEALDGADVATLITRAADPFVTAEMLPPGIHVNAVGAIVPHRRELTADAVAAFDLIGVDSLPQARKDAGELLAAEQAGNSPWDRTQELAALVQQPPRRGSDDRTLLKALGVGLADVALGAELARRAAAQGAGRPLPTSTT